MGSKISLFLDFFDNFYNLALYVYNIANYYIQNDRKMIYMI
jgi:hypothetical protein